MSSSRRKGNALEAWFAKRLHAVDGVDEHLAGIQTPTGRLGSTYRLQVDVASQRYKAEAKNREDLPNRLWEWLDQLARQPLKKVPLLVLKRNGRRPLVVLDAEDFLELVERDRARWLP